MRNSRLMCAVAAMSAAALVSGCVTINLVPGPGAIEEKQVSGTGKEKVLLLEVSGLISSHESDGFTEQPSVDELPEVPVDGGQAHSWRSADDQSVDFLGSGVRLDTSDHLEHRVARGSHPQSPVPQCDLGALDARWAGIVRCPSNSHPRDDSHFHQPLPGRKAR